MKKFKIFERNKINVFRATMNNDSQFHYEKLEFCENIMCDDDIKQTMRLFHRKHTKTILIGENDFVVFDDKNINH